MILYFAGNARAEDDSKVREHPIDTPEAILKGKKIGIMFTYFEVEKKGSVIKRMRNLEKIGIKKV